MDANVIFGHFEGALHGGGAGSVNYHIEPGNPGFNAFCICKVEAKVLSTTGKRRRCFGRAAMDARGDTRLLERRQDRRSDEPVCANQANPVVLKIN